MISPTDDARASLRLAKQKIARAINALSEQDIPEARRQIDFAEIDLDDAMTVLPDESLEARRG
jgi:vacuolar-type H+-ATPase subunit D/Vma8